MSKKSWKDKKILILGFAREGASSFRYLVKEKVSLNNIFVADRREYKNFDSEEKKLLGKLDKKNKNLGEDYLKNLENFDIIIKTAGIKIDTKKWQKIKKTKTEITTNLDIFLENVKGKVIGVTGTKGKSTTTSLIYKIFKTAGKRVVLAGNIGKPTLDNLQKNESDIFYILELSSYHLDTIKENTIDTAVITSFFAEHLNYHGSEKKYFEAKMNITKALKKNKPVIIPENINNKVIKYLEKNKIKTIKISADCCNIKTKLKGKHNHMNAMLAGKIAKLYKIKEEIIKKTIASFKNLEHRLEFVGEFQKIKFYNDVLSTTPESTIEAINALEKENPKTIIVGGMDRGLEYKNLAKKIIGSSIENVIYWPHTGEKIAKEIKAIKGNKRINLILVRNMKETIEETLKKTKAGETVLLSPASSSYDFYRDYREKGEEYKKRVNELGK